MAVLELQALEAEQTETAQVRGSSLSWSC
ncbi:MULTISPECIES: class III lanthipeptide [Cellulomonas]